MESGVLGPRFTFTFGRTGPLWMGVEYSNSELIDLISKKPDRKNLLAVHEVKNQFEGEVVPAEDTKDFKLISRW